MWALRRASAPLRNRGFSICASSASFADSELPIFSVQDKAGNFESSGLTSDMCLSSKGFHRRNHVSANVLRVRRTLSSQAGEKSSGEEDDLMDGFSELEETDSVKTVQNTNAQDVDEDELISEPDFSEDEYEVADSSKNELEMDTEAGLSESVSSRTNSLLRTVMVTRGMPLPKALDEWVKEGNDLSRGVILFVIRKLRKYRMYGKALQFSEWLESRKKLELVERDYASRVDLIAKVYGPQRAEKFIEKIPKSLKGELVYRTLLANCVQANNSKKAEEVFNKIKDLELPLTSFTCNQLLLLYKRTDRKKIADVLLLMEKENVKPCLMTYRILIDVKGQSNDITGMEHILETMKAEGIETDTHTKAVLARNYAIAGLKEKAEAVLKEMEGDNLNEDPKVRRYLLLLYAELGHADEVERVWKACESNPRTSEFLAAIEAWGKLKKVKKAEDAFEKMLKAVKKPSAVHYNALLRVYANHKMLTRGKDLIKRMAENDGKISRMTLDSVVKLYVEAGEIEKADSVLQKATQQNQLKPLYVSYMAIMDEYAKKGDIHNTEKMFLRMKQAGYDARFRQFQALIQAYVNAKTPAYGIRERMKADNIFPNRALAAQLTQVDAFRKTAASELLD
ncbi:hypothetical protein L484_002071 [Morus notabilis]|uniref:Pentacotripeptide-repeat region of PRORP domain-containing protein n=1 Tax=Morus notabilis TaxID=981085 RepID=W9SEY3_9ROSA|nr:pentatricopeptide repeat-containing protein At1g80270, mitochondrial [Morus notabilis]EXC46728.1 hypothetical protein L484_002071 [Morus notabilis]